MAGECGEIGVDGKQIWVSLEVIRNVFGFFFLRNVFKIDFSDGFAQLCEYAKNH